MVDFQSQKIYGVTALLETVRQNSFKEKSKIQ